MTTVPRLRTITQYRLTWKREGMNPKHKRYNSMRPIERMKLLLGPEPWKAIDEDPDERCCSGLECGCGGRTHRELMLERRKDLPPIEWMKVTTRQVMATPWEDS